jgi:hypothetical protein
LILARFSNQARTAASLAFCDRAAEFARRYSLQASCLVVGLGGGAGSAAIGGTEGGAAIGGTAGRAAIGGTAGETMARTRASRTTWAFAVYATGGDGW